MPTYVPLTGLPFQYIDPVTKVPMVNGTLSFFLSGTTTPTNIFSNNAGASIGTIVTLDSGGFPASGGNIVNLFRDKDINYKVVLKNAAGATLGTFDTLDYFNGLSTAASGTAAAPAITLGDGTTVEDDTGFYRSSADTWRWVAAGTVVYTITLNAITMASTAIFANGSGTVAAPGITFAVDLDSGFYWVSANRIGMTLNGVKIIDFKTTEVEYTVPVVLKSYTVATLPAVGTAGGMIYVTNEVGGATPAFSDAVNWRRVADRAIVS